MRSRCGAFLTATQEFEVAIADTPATIAAACRLRHQVYCVERGYEQGNGALETDRFDARSGHALLTHRSTGLIVGTVRVVAPSLGGSGADLPMQRFCAPDLFRALPLDSTGEVSRFAISKSLRDAGCKSDASLRLGLVQAAVRLSVQMGITHWCAIMEPTLLCLLRVSSIHFQPLGPAIEHRGLRQPSWASLGDLLSRMKHERPAVWDYITEGGSLRREASAVAEAA